MQFLQRTMSYKWLIIFWWTSMQPCPSTPTLTIISMQTAMIPPPPTTTATITTNRCTAVWWGYVMILWRGNGKMIEWPFGKDMLFQWLVCIFHLISSHLISSHLISSHLISSHLVCALILGNHTEAIRILTPLQKNPQLSLAVTAALIATHNASQRPGLVNWELSDLIGKIWTTDWKNRLNDRQRRVEQTERAIKKWVTNGMIWISFCITVTNPWIHSYLNDRMKTVHWSLLADISLWLIAISNPENALRKWVQFCLIFIVALLRLIDLHCGSINQGVDQIKKECRSSHLVWMAQFALRLLLMLISFFRSQLNIPGFVNWNFERCLKYRCRALWTKEFSIFWSCITTQWNERLGGMHDVTDMTR